MRRQIKFEAGLAPSSSPLLCCLAQQHRFFDSLKSPFQPERTFSLPPVAGYAVGGFYAACVFYMPVAAAKVLRSDILARGQIAVFL